MRRTSRVGSKPASNTASPATGGLHSPAEVADAGAAELRRAGLSEGVADRVVENARTFPAIDVAWEGFPDAIASGQNRMCEVAVRNDGGGASVGIRVTVNGVEMTATETYLTDSATLPVGVFGADADELEFTVEVTFPDEPLHPVRAMRTVDVAE